jgi:hypothetical protein
LHWGFGSEVGLGGFGWVFRFFCPCAGHVLECLDLFLLRRLRIGFFGTVVDIATIVFVPSCDGASLSSELFEAIVSVGLGCLAMCNAFWVI